MPFLPKVNRTLDSNEFTAFLGNFLQQRPLQIKPKYWKI
jgi:hypothetical protein